MEKSETHPARLAVSHSRTEECLGLRQRNGVPWRRLYKGVDGSDKKAQPVVVSKQSFTIRGVPVNNYGVTVGSDGLVHDLRNGSIDVCDDHFTSRMRTLRGTVQVGLETVVIPSEEDVRAEIRQLEKVAERVARTGSTSDASLVDILTFEIANHYNGSFRGLMLGRGAEANEKLRIIASGFRKCIEALHCALSKQKVQRRPSSLVEIKSAVAYRLSLIEAFTLKGDAGLEEAVLPEGYGK